MDKINLTLGDLFFFIKEQEVEVIEEFPNCFVQTVCFNDGIGYGAVITADSLSEAKKIPIPEDYFKGEYCKEDVSTVEVEPYTNRLYRGDTINLPAYLINYQINSIKLGSYRKNNRTKAKSILQIGVKAKNEKVKKGTKNG